MYQTSKGSSNSDVQNKGQGKDPRIIRGDKIRDPFRERRLSFTIKEKKDAPPLFIVSARGACSVELTTSDNIERALELIRKVTQLEPLSVLAVKTAFTSWQDAEKHRAERIARIAVIQDAEIELVNIVRGSVVKYIRQDMKLAEIRNEIRSDKIELEIISELQKRIAERKDAEKSDAEKSDAEKSDAEK